MLISKAVGIISLALAVTTASVSARAAILETQTIDNWTLNAYSSETTGRFQSCSMKTAGNDQVYLNLAANLHNRWFLSLYRLKWDLEPNARFIATLNLDQGRKQPIALDAKVTNEHFIALALPPERRVLDLFSKAWKARVTRESKVYTFSLAGYYKAVQWTKACIARYTTQEAFKPDATIRNGDDDPDAGNSDARRPAELPKQPPKLPPGTLEVKANDPAKPDMLVASVPSAATASSGLTSAATSIATSTPAERPQTPTQVASAPTTTAPASTPTNPISEAAKASPTPISEPPVVTISPAQLLLPKLMAAANRSDFKVLDATAAPSALKNADVVFGLTGMTGVVIAYDMPTAEAATNEVLAYDRIACGGDYSATTDPVEDGHADVLRSTSECKSGGKSVRAHYLTLSKKSGGFYVVALTSEGAAPTSGSASDKLAEVDHALFDAAVKVSGKF